MVVFVDLEEESEPPERLPHWSLLNQRAHRGFEGLASVRRLSLRDQGDGRENPNKNAIAEALGCYPYVTSFWVH
jgi:hypothetical protein